MKTTTTTEMKHSVLSINVLFPINTNLKYISFMNCPASHLRDIGQFIPPFSPCFMRGFTSKHSYIGDESPLMINRFMAWREPWCFHWTLNKRLINKLSLTSLDVLLCLFIRVFLQKFIATLIKPGLMSNSVCWIILTRQQYALNCFNFFYAVINGLQKMLNNLIIKR